MLSIRILQLGLEREFEESRLICVGRIENGEMHGI
jgi:hypothetical protein